MRNSEVKVKPLLPKRWRLWPLGLILILAWWAIRPYSVINVSSPRAEMVPDLIPGQKALIFRHGEKEGYQVGDILLYRYDGGSWRYGRVVAREGEGVKLQGSFLKASSSWALEGIQEGASRDYGVVAPGHLFIVHNDQNLEVEDSLVLGAMSLEGLEIRGKVFFVWGGGP